MEENTIAMIPQNTLMIFALIGALGVLSVEVVDLLLFLQAEAIGCKNPKAINASGGKCVR